MKLLVSRYTCHRIMLAVIGLFFVGMMTTVMMFHADVYAAENNDGDYFMCKLCALMPAMAGVVFPMVLMAQEYQGSRFMRSVPGADRMYRFGIPLFCSAVTLAWFAVTNMVYAAFILITGRELVNISDMMALSGGVGLIFSVESCCIMSLRLGGVTFILYYLPFFLVFSIPKGNTGFGIPIIASAVIFAAGIAIGYVVSLLMSCTAYRKSDFKESASFQSKIAH